jgi:Nif-specific regulatory protein
MPRNTITKRYQIIRPLGEGGMGEVFLVEDRWEQGRQVALKRLRAEILSNMTREAFAHEFTALKQLRHPNLAAVYDFGYTPQGDPFFTSEYCPGDDLIASTAQAGFGERVERVVEICRALAYIHARGYIHADLKPGNILVVKGDHPVVGRVKLLDFGLARHVRDEARQRLSGTLDYLAPEVIKGRPPDFQSDLYALGAVFYQLFARQLPFGDVDPQLLVDMQLSVTPTPPTERDGTLPVCINAILLRLLEKNPEDRFHSPDEIIQVLNRDLGYRFEVETHATARDYIQSGQFVGRTEELDRLKLRLGQILKGKGGGLVLVGGESGVGKTRLLEEFKIHSQLEGVRTIVSAAYEKIAQPLQCFLEVLRPLAMSADQGSPSQRSLVEKYEPVLVQVLPQLFESKIKPTVPGTSSGGEKELLLESLAMFVLEACADQPTLILINDLHWADALSLELIERLTRNLASHRLILGASYRLDEVEGTPLESTLPVLSSLEATDVIGLKPLAPEEVGLLVNSMLGIEQTPSSLVQRIVRDTSGNPFFIQEVLWSWMQERIVSPRMGGWQGDSSLLDSLPIPRTMADAFRRRISHLPASDRGLLEVVALFNQPAPLTALVAVAGRSPVAIEPQISRLVENAILARTDSPDAPEYFFHHAQMKRSIESEVNPERAEKIHLSIGGYFEIESASSPADQSEIMAYHFAAGGEHKKARFYSIRAGDKLRKLFLYQDAINAYHTAERLSEPGGAGLLEIREKIAFCHFQMGGLDQAEKIYRSLLEQGGRLVTPGRMAKLHLHLGRIAEYRGRYEEAISINNAGLALIESLPEPKTKAQLLARIGFEYQRLSKFRIALDYALQALALVEHLENFMGLGEIYNEKFIIHYSLGDYSNALEAGHRAIAVYTKFGWMTGIAGVTANIGLIYEYHLCEYSKAFDYQRRALHLREKIFDRRGIEQSYLNLSSIHCKMGEFSMALQYLDRAAQLNETMPERHLEMLIANHRGENWTPLGEFVKARAALDTALQMAESSHNQQVKISTLNRISEWHEKLGEWDEARTASLTALRLAVETENGIEELCARLQLARLEIEQHNWTEADNCLDLASAAANQMNHTDWKLQSMLLRALRVFRIGHFGECLSVLAQARPLVEKIESPLMRAQYFWLQGQVSLIQEDRYHYVGADHLHQALRAAESTEDLDLLATTQHALGQWYLSHGDHQNAHKYFQQACSILSAVADRLPETLRRKYLEKEGRAIILNSTKSFAQTDSLEVKDQDMPDEKLAALSLHRQNYFVTLFQISKIVNSILNLNELLERVMDLVLEAIRVERGLILLVNEDSGELEVKVARNISKATIEDATAISKTVLEDVIHGGKPLISVNALEDQRLRERRSIVDFGIAMVLCLPLTVKEKIIGAVYIDNSIATLPFDEQDVNFLMSFTNLFAIAIENSRLYEKLHQENIYLRQQVRGKYSYEKILGRGPRMMELFRRLDSVVTSSANVLITGESGTGKELIAQAIHYNGSRKDKRFVAIDCGAIPENLIESELFGFKKGAFTGAMVDKKGLFEEADGGTIFLDEITNTSRTLQAKLLRVIQEREIRRVGDSVDRRVDVRLIAATNRDLRQMVQSGEFREDLFYRLNVLNLNIPPLRERREDIPLLINHLIKELVQQNPGMPRTISRDATRMLMRYDFPGNVRELENLVESAYYMAQSNEIQIKDFPPEITQFTQTKKISEGARATEKTVEAAEEIPTPTAKPLSTPSTATESGENEERALTLYWKIRNEKISFWKVVKEPFMNREISKEVVREVVKIGLSETRGRYKDLMKHFNIPASDYTVFMNFLRKHNCQVDFKPFRQKSPN